MKSNKMLLGDLITQRREKNPGGNLPIRGVSSGHLIPPKQIDADTSIYNAFYLNDFVFNPARMELGAIAFNDQYDIAICSSLYEVFFVNRTDIIVPEYLAMVVTRKEFARYCDFLGSGSAREYCRFTNISEIEITVPPIEEQRKIVRQYKVVTERISTLSRINDNLAEQAQLLIKIFMKKEAFDLKPLSNIAKVIDCLHSEKPKYDPSGTKQLIQLDNITDAGFLDMKTLQYMISDSDYALWTRNCEIKEGDCVITNVGRVGSVSQAPSGTLAAMGRNMTCIRLEATNKWPSYLITLLLSEHIKMEISKNTDMGTIMSALNVKDIPKLRFPIFSQDTMLSLENKLHGIRKHIETNYMELQILHELENSLLTISMFNC